MHITTHCKKRKRAGMTSLNTDNLSNPFCQKMRESKNTICSSCYAYSQLKLYKSLQQHCADNSKELTDPDFQPFGVMDRVFRFNSFGELINDQHLLNLIKIVNYNPNTTFALWTKRQDVVARVFADTKKPDNLILIYSSPLKNVQGQALPVFDKVFTVYDNACAESVEINCRQKCSECLLCYSHNDIKYVNETLR
jgi:hypothetical protein